MASSKLGILVALGSLIVLTTFIGSSESASCCLMYTRHPVSCRRMLGYTIQTINNSCDINAIIFHLRGRFVCADPSVAWTRRRVQCLDMRRNTQIFREGTQGNTTSA